MTATSAARDAGNRDEFFDAAEAVVGTRPELLSGLEEGRLSFQGATADLDPADGPFLVCDIGGGSTEFSYGTTEAEATISTDMGCVRITEAWLHGDPPTAEELSQALSVIEIHVDDVVREIPDATDVATFVGLAGTVSATAAVELGLAELRPRPHPSLPAHQARRRGRVPHPRHRAARRPHPQPGPRAGAGRRDRRWPLRAGDDHAADGLPASASSRSPTSSTGWRCRWRPAGERGRRRPGLAVSPDPSQGASLGSPAVTTLFGRRVLLRPLVVSDFPAWREVRRRNDAWLTRWEPTAHPGHPRRRRRPRGLLGALQCPPARAPAGRRLRLRGVRGRRVRRRDQPVVGPAGSVPERLRRLLDRRGEGGQRLHTRSRRGDRPLRASRSSASTASRSRSSPATGPATG